MILSYKIGGQYEYNHNKMVALRVKKLFFESSDGLLFSRYNSSTGGRTNN